MDMGRMLTTTDWVMVGLIAVLMILICVVATTYRDKLCEHEFEEFEKYDGFKEGEDGKKQE